MRTFVQIIYAYIVCLHKAPYVDTNLLLLWQ